MANTTVIRGESAEKALAMDPLKVPGIERPTVTAGDLTKALDKYVEEVVEATRDMQVRHAAGALNFPYNRDPREVGPIENLEPARERARKSAVDAFSFIWQHRLLEVEPGKIRMFENCELSALQPVARILTLAGIEAKAEMLGGRIEDNPDFNPRATYPGPHGILVGAKPGIFFPSYRSSGA